MSKREFRQQCDALENDGWVMLDYQPEAKYARFTKNGQVKTIGVMK